MKTWVFSFFLFTGLIWSFILEGQSRSAADYFTIGKVIEGNAMESRIMKMNISYSVYLPPDYDVSSRSYPVLYLLHGFTDNETAWVQYGEVQQSLDRMIACREIPPMIVVMPDAGVSWYINDASGRQRYEDMIFQEFIPFIDRTYRTRTQKEFRAVSGLSMGGYGSLIWALHHPEMFSSCAAFSSAIFTEGEILKMPAERYNNYFKTIYTGDQQVNRISDHWKKNSVLDLMLTLPKEQVEKVKFYIDCGDDDATLYRGNSELHNIMRERNIYHEFRIRDGAHNWTYWRTNIGEGLIFIGKGFHR